MVVRGIAVVAIWLLVIGVSYADCGGASRATPIRNAIASRPTPIVNLLHKIQSNREMRRSACSGAAVGKVSEPIGCSGSAPLQKAPSCSESIVIPVAPAPPPTAIQAVPVFTVVPQSIGYELYQAPGKEVCVSGQCSIVKNVLTAPARMVNSLYHEALASAQYRAANRIHGHSTLDTHRTSGVGWASHHNQPTTCLGVGGETYAVARGSDGWYSTKFQASR